MNRLNIVERSLRSLRALSSCGRPLQIYRQVQRMEQRKCENTDGTKQNKRRQEHQRHLVIRCA
ncbi:hypothetical protein T12_5506 [Trichinella patagoniensis]|uniref:Uncharacterized protein n=1 Tax=Trichinella patagoniensis TaxID=990121 RepID=A0A0V0ZNF2_9BILA|nr:hypothetical protein T12_5506 [Trichinella patagoniensis]